MLHHFFMHGPENIDKRVTLYTQLKFCMRFVLSYKYRERNGVCPLESLGNKSKSLTLWNLSEACYKVGLCSFKEIT